MFTNLAIIQGDQYGMFNQQWICEGKCTGYHGLIPEYVWDSQEALCCFDSEKTRFIYVYTHFETLLTLLLMSILIDKNRLVPFLLWLLLIGLDPIFPPIVMNVIGDEPDMRDLWHCLDNYTTIFPCHASNDFAAQKSQPALHPLLQSGGRRTCRCLSPVQHMNNENVWKKTTLLAVFLEKDRKSLCSSVLGIQKLQFVDVKKNSTRRSNAQSILNFNGRPRSRNSLELKMLKALREEIWRIWSPICAGWWFEPLWKILVSWDDYSQYMGK